MAKEGKIKVRFIGMNAEEVTGSMILIESKGLNILLEAGLYQTNDVLRDYKVNNRNLNINLKKIDFILVGHAHADHTMLIPRLYAEGCKARIIMPTNNIGFYKLLGKDSAGIIERDCMALEREYSKSFHRAYEESDVNASVEYIEEYPLYEKIELTDRLTIRYIPSGHITGAAQIEIWIANETHTHTAKILYTSDLGNTKILKPYVTPFEPVEKANLVIGESTYATQAREVTRQVRKKDIQKMHDVIEYTEGIVEIPVFAMDRCAQILTMLYEIFGSNPNFTKKIVVDSPLAIDMLKNLEEVLDDEEYLKLKEVLEWKNVILLRGAEEHNAFMLTTHTNTVVLATAGMLCVGRSRAWLKKLIEDNRNVLMCVGYASPNTLAGKIKGLKDRDTIKIDGVEYKARCSVVDLKSFTSHMQYSDLLKYYSTIAADKVVLVHGDFKVKCVFAKTLQEEIIKTGGRAKVLVANKSTEINL